MNNRRLVIKNPVLDVELVREYLLEHEIPFTFSADPNYFSTFVITLDEANADIVRSKFGAARVDYEELVLL